jgi:hypothetical protein
VAKATDPLSVIHLGGANKQAISKFRIPSRQCNPGYDFLLGTTPHEIVDLLYFNDKFVEERSCKAVLEPGAEA